MKSNRLLWRKMLGVIVLHLVLIVFALEIGSILYSFNINKNDAILSFLARILLLDIEYIVAFIY